MFRSKRRGSLACVRKNVDDRCQMTCDKVTEDLSSAKSGELQDSCRSLCGIWGAPMWCAERRWVRAKRGSAVPAASYAWAESHCGFQCGAGSGWATGPRTHACERPLPLCSGSFPWSGAPSARLPQATFAPGSSTDGSRAPVLAAVGAAPGAYRQGATGKAADGSGRAAWLGAVYHFVCTAPSGQGDSVSRRGSESSG